MMDIGQILRKAYVSALRGNLSIDGNVIPVVDEKLDVNISENDTYVMIMDQVEDLQTNQVKNYFSNECLLRMQLVNQRKATNTKEIIEDVAGQILNILFPNKQTITLSIDSPLNLSYARYVNGIYNPVTQDQTGFSISKIMTFKNRVTQ